MVNRVYDRRFLLDAAGKEFQVKLVRACEDVPGVESAKLMHRNLEFWWTTKNEAAMEQWRQRQAARMFSQPGLAMQLSFAAEQPLALSSVP